MDNVNSRMAAYKFLHWLLMKRYELVSFYIAEDDHLFSMNFANKYLDIPLPFPPYLSKHIDSGFLDEAFEVLSNYRNRLDYLD